MRSSSLAFFTRWFSLLLCTLPFVSFSVLAAAAPQSQADAAQETSSRISDQQLDALVGPIALYPDSLLAQVLVASTYPLEIVQLQQWLEQHKDLKGAALVQAVEKQKWDPSVQALAVLPDVVKHLSDNIKWTIDLGNAFLAQESDTLDAVQRMRVKAQTAGNLKSTDQQAVEVKQEQSKTVVVIEQKDPEVVYVPYYSYDVYGDSNYYYESYASSYYAAGAAVGYSAGVAVGYYWGRNNWGWRTGWGYNNIYVNNNNAFLKNYNQQAINAGNRLPGSNNIWQHDPQHRGGAPYGNREVANRFGGATPGSSPAGRQPAAPQNVANSLKQGPAGNSAPGGGALPGSSGPNSDPAPGGEHIGARQLSPGPGSGAFGGAASGLGNAGAHASQFRGGASMGAPPMGMAPPPPPPPPPPFPHP